MGPERLTGLLGLLLIMGGLVWSLRGHGRGLKSVLVGPCGGLPVPAKGIPFGLPGSSRSHRLLGGPGGLCRHAELTPQPLELLLHADVGCLHGGQLGLELGGL